MAVLSRKVFFACSRYYCILKDFEFSGFHPGAGYRRFKPYIARHPGILSGNACPRHDSSF
jgi:hypothetical protein